MRENESSAACSSIFWATRSIGNYREIHVYLFFIADESACRWCLQWRNDLCVISRLKKKNRRKALAEQSMSCAVATEERLSPFSRRRYSGPFLFLSLFDLVQSCQARLACVFSTMTHQCNLSPRIYRVAPRNPHQLAIVSHSVRWSVFKSFPTAPIPS